jgi:hypothetical protein
MKAIGTTWLVGAVLLFAGGASAAPRCKPVPPDIISWWPGEGTTTDIVGPNNGQLSATGATYVPGLVGQAFHFTATGDPSITPYGGFLAPTQGMPTGTADRTIEGWVSFDPGQDDFFAQSHAEAAFFGYGGFGWPNTSFALGTGPDYVPFMSIWTSNVQWTSPLTHGSGQWHHLATTSASTLITLYVDGQPVNSSNYWWMNTMAGTQFMMGHIPVPANPACCFRFGDYRALNGSVDEVSVYGRALSAAEIGKIFTASSAGKCFDADGDGVPDDHDQCPNTPAGAAVDASGCSIDQLCVCHGDHGQYQKCIVETTKSFIDQGLIDSTLGAIASQEAQNGCPNTPGKK